ncbi:threonine/serine exporter family protein [Cohnella sp. REN36]|uniref:threonine/serine exporter family protein n=1 Tax=Cohnella sp. REN36 TaxID=2887347 RepID=UPI001D15A96A|nr:threonine/serine exporter family protein [Cohnella sp. REN36]MCC3377441.1 threonine/serine exporter family protein [Cohnella sp. REN36]
MAIRYLEQLLASFIGTAAFGVLFQVPRRTLVQCGLVGTAGWLLNFGLLGQSVDAAIATWASAFLVALLAHGMAIRFKVPVTVFIVSGIIPLVPGGLAYDAMRKIVQNDYEAAVQLGAKAFMLSGAIAIGLVFSEVVLQIAKRARHGSAA